MNLEDGCKILLNVNKIQDIFSIVNLLNIKLSVEKNILIISVSEKEDLKSKNEKEVAHFLMEHFVFYFKKSISPFCYNGCSIEPIVTFGEKFVVTYPFSFTQKKYKNKWLFIDFLEALYFAVDEAKVEYCFFIEEDSTHSVPIEILWELDTWNDGCYENEVPEECISPEDLKVYKFKKQSLYGISLGYYDIDLSLLETDIVPELIGVIFDSTEIFCYVTSYEDEEYVYIYSATKLTEDNIFDIEEGLFNLLEIISTNDNKRLGTLEDYYYELKGE